MKKLIFSMALCLFLMFNCHAQAPFQVTYPVGSTATNPVAMSDYSDTANGKIIMAGWPNTGNLTINSFNISNNNYPCGSSAPYPASNTIYLNELFTGAGYTLCYASGPMPDTIMYYLLDPITSAARDTMYFVVGGSFPASVSDREQKKLTISPNPAQSYIVINELSANDEVTIYTIGGAALIRSTGTHANNRISIDLLPLGLYIVEVKNKNGMLKREKFLKD